MKFKDLIIITIAIVFIAICTRELINEITLERIGLTLIPLYIIIYVILAIRHEKRLESELHAEDEAYGRLEVLYDFLEKDKEQLEIDLSNQVKATDDLQKMYNNLINKEIPFNEDNDKKEELYLCPVCSKEMRQTKCYHICDNCNKRVKKSSYGVILIT